MVVETLLVPVASIDPNPWNPNEMRERVFEAVGESLQEFGQLLPLIVRPHPEDPDRYQIIDGEHRWRQACAQGLAEIECRILQVDDPTAKRLTLILAEGGEHNKYKLAVLLQDLHSELDVETLLRGISHTQNELEELLEIAEFDWSTLASDPPPEDPPAGPDPEPEEVLSIKGEALSKLRAAYNRVHGEPGSLQDIIIFILELAEGA